MGSKRGRCTVTTPEELARIKIDELLAACGWIVQDRGQLYLAAGRGVAVREFPMGDEGFADYLLFVDRKPVGVIEAKAQGTTFAGRGGTVGQVSGGYGESARPGCAGQGGHRGFEVRPGAV